ncbi:8443_t:CDS:10 [Funneliformis geosporum]|uniref:9054_t:CDS:1 n=2 Tax=Funneliformis TaxID=1117308 RepID=A0A9W4SWG8_9GLOM|nr:9054_t:CDS:10 [Funneliformis geosporum]CAI2191769.1 8443_t:CDS:10 [Funneliformis geosporum]
MEKSTLLRFSDFVKDFDYDYLSPEKAWEDLENAYTSYLDTLEQTTSEKTRESIYDLRQNWTSTKKRTQNNFFNYCLQMREKHAERKVQTISHSAACNAISANVEKVEKNVISGTKSGMNDDGGSFQNPIVVSKDETGAFTPANGDNDLKRKREDNESNEELASLFDESNEDALLENINEKALEKEKQLPSSNDRSSKDPPYMCENVIRSFGKYQNCIPKTRRVITPAYWGVLDLTGESLYDCKQFTAENILQLSQDFADKIKWKTKPAEKNIIDYFDNECTKKVYGIEKLDVNIQFMKSDMHTFQNMMTEEELKMCSTFPLFRGVFTSDHIKNVWGEVQALPTNDARNEKGSPFKRARIGRRVDMKSTLVKTANKFEVIYGEVAGGLGPLGIPTACRKKRYLDKLKLMIVMRDGINRLLRECKHVPNDKRTSVIIYGWLQVGLELNFYAMDWCGAGIYRFGMVDRCRLPSDDSDCGILEDAYCILKLLEERSLETEKVVKKFFLENTQRKRRHLAPENEAKLTETRTPKK